MFKKFVRLIICFIFCSRDVFSIMSVAFSSANCKYPGSQVREQLLYENKKDFVNDCEYYSLPYNEETDEINFRKGVLGNTKLVRIVLTISLFYFKIVGNFIGKSKKGSIYKQKTI